MAIRKKAAPKAKAAVKHDDGLVPITIQRDGVFIAADVRKDKGDKAHVDPEMAKLLIERGHAKPV